MDGIHGGKLQRYHRVGCAAHLDDASLDADADADVDLVEMDGCYIPNNPAQYGLVELSPGHLQSYPGTSRYLHPQPLGSAGQPTGGGKGYSGYGLGCNGLSGSGNNLSAATSGGGNSGNGGVYWSTDDMGSFSLPGLDLDPLPSLFPFSPCSSNNYNPPREFVQSSSCKEKQPHDMADVLLSLKHAIVHPGQTGPMSPVFPCAYGSASASASASGGQPAYQVPSASLSYTVHPHQMMSPGGGYSSSQYCGGGQDQYGGGGGGGGGQPMHHNMFPSMSVNVSMNMTMHGYPTNVADNIQHQMTCPQMQWAAAPPNLSPVYPPPQGMMSPSAYPNGATYSFTADFRPPPPPPLTELPMSPPLVSYKPKMSPLYQASVASASPLRPAKRTPKPTPAAVADESSRPNLCRICGKTYARPSTLKTHLRTHSGEKPYRCCDCNKTFSQAANLTAHVRTHSGEKPFRCPICDRRFSQSSSVTTHMRTHSGERPYRCRMCKKAFSDSSTLTKHLRIHSGEKPYQCKLCLLRFSQSGNLNRHMRVHGGSGNGTP